MIDGLVVVDKPAGWTSHDVVARARKVFGQKKVGHSGTLDPGATGVLLLGLGRATRLLAFLTGLAKEYAGELVLGTATSTLDDAGDVTGRWDMAGVGLDQVRQAAAGFVGPIDQVPPMVSAVQVGGRRLHQLAREGVEVERVPRRVVVGRLEVAAAPSGDPGVFSLDVRCSSGTYVRSLAADIGTALGGGAHLRNLRRTAVGSFTLAEAVALDLVGPDRVLSPAEAVRDLPCLVVGAEVATEVGHGQVLGLDRLGAEGAGEGPWAVLDHDGGLLAVYRPYREGLAKPAMVMPPARS